jgi:hypothetical protein
MASAWHSTLSGPKRYLHVSVRTTAAPSKELFEVLEGAGNAELAKLEFPTNQWRNVTGRDKYLVPCITLVPTGAGEWEELVPCPLGDWTRAPTTRVTIFCPSA